MQSDGYWHLRDSDDFRIPSHSFSFLGIGYKWKQSVHRALQKRARGIDLCAVLEDTSLKLENILSPSQDSAKTSGPGAIVIVTRAPYVIQGYLRLFICSPLHISTNFLRHLSRASEMCLQVMHYR